METIEYHFTEDKEDWGDGPWIKEPDKIQFPDERTGYPCLIVRGPMGGLCGYVGVNKNHPGFEMNYNDLPDGVECHGGVTFTDKCVRHGKEHGICHIPGDDETDDIWWFGFDCGHLDDYLPKMESQMGIGLCNVEGYRTVNYVKHEVMTLAYSLKDMENVS